MTRRAYTPGQGPGLELMLALVCAACGVAALLLGAGGLAAAMLGGVCGAAGALLIASLASRMAGPRIANRQTPKPKVPAPAPAPAPKSASAVAAPAPDDSPSTDDDVYTTLTVIAEPPTDDEVAQASPADTAKDDDQADAAGAPAFDFDAFASRLLESSDPIAELRLIVHDIRDREAAAADGDAPAADAPNAIELFCARQLEEAGLFDDKSNLPSLTIVRPPTSHMLYLKVAERRISYQAKLAVISIEAALNAVRFACMYFESPEGVTVDDCYLLSHNLLQSICAQSPGLDEPIEDEEGERPDGEWAVRRKISQTIESLQLPYRLDWSLRSNVRDGNVSIDVELTPSRAFAKSAHVDGLGTVETTRDMRRAAASAYALRVAILMAATAFRASEKVLHVWVAGSLETPSHRWCYYTVDFDRWRFSRLDLAHVDDLEAAMRPFVPNMRLEDGFLKPVERTFSPSEHRFCPPARYEAVSLSARRLTGDVARDLGCDHVAGLAIEEADKRRLVAQAIMAGLMRDPDTTSCEKSVRVVLENAADDPDPTVRSACERTARKLVDGTLDGDPLDVAEEFVNGDALTMAVRSAKESLKRKLPDEAIRKLSPVVADIDAAGLYADSDTVAYRFFNNYVDRALFNRIGDAAGRSVALVPDSYFEAHLLLASAHLLAGNREQALAESLRLLELSGLDYHTSLLHVRCLESLDRTDQAIDELRRLLEVAHDPIGVSLGYYRMAFFQWQKGNLMAAQACYQRSLKFAPDTAGLVATEMAVLAMQNPSLLGRELTPEEVVSVLTDAQIPLAPTEDTALVLLECARASLDAEVFPVARNFAHVLGAFGSDDVLAGIIRSLEGAPDS